MCVEFVERINHNDAENFRLKYWFCIEINFEIEMLVAVLNWNI